MAETQLDDFWVSTVFLGLDHNFSDHGPPILFETIAFAGQDASTMLRYATGEEKNAAGE